MTQGHRIRMQFIGIRLRDSTTSRCTRIQSMKNDHELCMIKLMLLKEVSALESWKKVQFKMNYQTYLKPKMGRDEKCKLLALGVTVIQDEPIVGNTTHYDNSASTNDTYSR